MMTRRTSTFGLNALGLNVSGLHAFSRPKSRLGRELVLVIIVKLTIIGLAALFVFGPNQRPRVDAAKVAAHLVGAPASPLSAAGSKGVAARSEIP